MKEDFSEEERQIGELFKEAKVSRSLCQKMREYVITNFKPAGRMIDALHELLFMNYQNFINSGSFDFVVAGVAEDVLGIYKEFTAGSRLGFDQDGYADGSFILNLGKRKQKSEELLLQRNGLSTSGLVFISRTSDDVVSDGRYVEASQQYAKATIADPSLWLTREKEAPGNVKVVLPPETRYNMTLIPKILKQYEFGVRLISSRTVEREKELTHLAHVIGRQSKKILSASDQATRELQDLVARAVGKFMRDELNQELFSALSIEATRLQYAESQVGARKSTQKILDILAGTLEYNVEENWLDQSTG